MSTFSQLQQRVLDFGFADSRYRDSVKTWLNEGQNYFVLQTDFRTQLETIDFATSAYNNALPTDFARLIEVANAEDASNWVVLDALEMRDFDMMEVTYGSPTNYLIAGQTLYLYPYPDQEYTISLTYYRLPTEMVNDGDVVDIPDHYESILVSYAVKRGFERENDYEAANYWANEMQQRIQEARGEAQFDTFDQPRTVPSMWGQLGQPLWRLP